MSATVSRSAALRDVRRGAAKFDCQGEGPGGLETNLVETIGIRKFLIAAMEDLRYQVEVAAKTTPRREFEELKAGAIVITAFLTEHLEAVDKVLGAGEKKSGS